jgi:hypothetical protein
MAMMILMGVLVGVVLGLRFKVFVLVPVICGALPVVAIDGVASGDGLLGMVFAMIVMAIALQMGYFLGNVLRFVMGSERSTNSGKVSMPTSAGMSGSV